MSSVQITALSLKILGIYSFIQSIPLIRAFVHAIGFPVEGPPMRLTLILGSSISLILFWGIGITLLFFSGLIAKRMVSQNEQIGSSKPADSKALQSIAFSVVGVVLICLAIPKLFQLSVNISVLQQPGIETPMRGKISNDTLAFGIAIGIQFLVGLFLFFGGEFLSGLWHMLVKRIQYEKNITSP